MEQYIAIVGLALTVLSLGIAQWKTYALAKRTEKRTEHKLKIHQILLDKYFTLSELVAEFQRLNPSTQADSVEIQKAVYEMLVDGTLLADQDLTFTSNTIVYEE